MILTEQIANHFRKIHVVGNGTSSNLKDKPADISWQQSTMGVHSFNTIAALAYHTINYVSSVLKILQGEPLNASEKYSFNLPPILSQEEWKILLDKLWTDAVNFASLLEQ